MGLFSFTQEIAVDLGTANTIIVCDGKIVVDAPSVVATRCSPSERRHDRCMEKRTKTYGRFVRCATE